MLIPVAQLIGQGLAALSMLRHAPCPFELASIAEKPGGDTIYMAAIDRERNIVSLIQSNFGGFGSGLVPEGAGFVLHTRGALFSLERSYPNALAPHKRPFTPLFRHSFRRTTFPSDSASWAAGIRRRPVRSSSLTLSILE